MLKVYLYKNCSTCRDAKKWLQGKGIAFHELPIRETPPSPAELKAMVAAQGGKLSAVFNTSSVDYRELGLKDRLPAMTDEEAFALQQTNGNLVKRPFVIGKGIGLVGFKAAEWEKAFA
jgi:arsenate reductase (glutaredoxin)